MQLELWRPSSAVRLRRGPQLPQGGPKVVHRLHSLLKHLLCAGQGLGARNTSKDKQAKQVHARTYISVQEDSHHRSKLSIWMDVINNDTCYKNETNGEWPRVALGWIFHFTEKEALAPRRWLASELWEGANPAEVFERHFRKERQVLQWKQAWCFEGQKDSQWGWSPVSKGENGPGGYEKQRQNPEVPPRQLLHGVWGWAWPRGGPQWRRGNTWCLAPPPPRLPAPYGRISGVSFHWNLKTSSH